MERLVVKGDDVLQPSLYRKRTPTKLLLLSSTVHIHRLVLESCLGKDLGNDGTMPSIEAQTNGRTVWVFARSLTVRSTDFVQYLSVPSVKRKFLFVCLPQFCSGTRHPGRGSVPFKPRTVIVVVLHVAGLSYGDVLECSSPDRTLDIRSVRTPFLDSHNGYHGPDWIKILISTNLNGTRLNEKKLTVFPDVEEDSCLKQKREIKREFPTPCLRSRRTLFIRPVICRQRSWSAVFLNLLLNYDRRPYTQR